MWSLKVNKLRPLILLFLTPLCLLAHTKHKVFLGSYLLSPTKQKILKLKKQEANEQYITNKYSWLSNFMITANHTKNGQNNDENIPTITTDVYGISLNQDIFRFGGIYSALKAADAAQESSLLNIDISNKQDLTSLFHNLIDLKVTDIKLKQNKLNIDNLLIEIRHKKSQYIQGQTDISDLNDAIINKNSSVETQKTLELQRLNDIFEIRKLTTYNYRKIIIPNFRIVTKSAFLKNSLDIAYAKSEVRSNEYSYKVKLSSYFPTISVNANYNKEDKYSYGMSLSLPLKFTEFNDIEDSKVKYLISQEELNDKKTTLDYTYASTKETIKNYKQKIYLARKDIALYNSLIRIGGKEEQGGYSTKDDIRTLYNSRKMRRLDIKAYKLDIKEQILNLYFKMPNS